MKNTKKVVLIKEYSRYHLLYKLSNINSSNKLLLGENNTGKYYDKNVIISEYDNMEEALSNCLEYFV